MALAALILGIVAMLSSFVGGAFDLGWIGSVCGVVAIVFGAITRKKKKSSMGTAGMILGIISLVWGIVATILCTVCVGLAAAAGSLF